MLTEGDLRRLLRRWFPRPTEADEPDRLLEALDATGPIPGQKIIQFAKEIGRVRRLSILAILERNDPSPATAGAQLSRAATLFRDGLAEMRATGDAPRLQMPELTREALISDIEADEPCDTDGDMRLDETLETVRAFCERLERVNSALEGSPRSQDTPYLTGTDRPAAPIISALLDIWVRVLNKPAKGKSARQFVIAYSRLLGFRAPSDNALRHRQRRASRVAI